MAQEVETIAPEAVVHRADGFLAVRYVLLGLRLQTLEEWTASVDAQPRAKDTTTSDIQTVQVSDVQPL